MIIDVNNGANSNEIKQMLLLFLRCANVLEEQAAVLETVSVSISFNRTRTFYAVYVEEAR